MPEAAPRVTVVIPNYNGLPHLPACLSSLSGQLFQEFAVTVVDNGSADGSADWVARHDPHIELIALDHNVGFAKAVNAGIRAAHSEYVVLLNNDTVAHPRWLGGLVAALDTHPSYDFAASKMVFHRDPQRLNAAGDVYNVLRLSGRNRGLGRPARQYGIRKRVLGACAGAAMYRRALFDDVGLFDEDFFLMSEDTDFNLRCLIAGKRCLYVPDALVRHKARASIDQAPAWEMARLASRNEALVAAKDLPLVLLFCPLLWIWRGLRQTVLLRYSKWHLIPGLVAHSGQRLQAEVEGARIGWRKRPQVWQHRVAGRREILRWLLWGTGPVTREELSDGSGA